jgi:outer membrane protein OmpA-like peptidoglycan-associated protein
MRFVCTLVFLVIQVYAFSQKPIQLGKNSSDCIGALLIEDTIVGPVFSYRGYGEKLEIQGYELGDPMFIEQEHNTVWYKFRVPYDSEFTMDIKPVNEQDDFDYMIFKYDGPNVCNEISSGISVPVRSNISRKNLITNGMTGLRVGEINEYVPSGPGSPYSRPIDVLRGQLYYMVIDNPFKENEGHTLFLNFKQTHYVETTQQEDGGQSPSKNIVSTKKLEINVQDQSTGIPIGSNISIEGLKIGETVDFINISKTLIDVYSYKNYTINVVQKGYMLSTQQFMPLDDSLSVVTIKLKSIKVGDKVTLDNIKFESDKVEILKKSDLALQQLYKFLSENENVNIEIQGHVNGEKGKNKKEYKQLSEDRANEVYNFLIAKGINKNRLSYKGYGNSQMLYPEPGNNGQAEANRRVEILVLDL